MATHTPEQLSRDRVLITDAGLETVLLFEHGIDLPAFAAFPLLDDPAGRDLMARYFTAYLELAARLDTGFILETPTWRANTDWAATLGYGQQDLRRVADTATAFARDLARQHGGRTVISGCIGPRGDGYVIERRMSADEAADYHQAQVNDFAAAGVDLVTSFTLSYADEAAGVAAAAAAASVPVVIGFTVETDGRLASGESLAAAIAYVDRCTGGYPAWFMVNCAHPDHVAEGIDAGAEWTSRVGAIRANASRLSHAALDAAETLDPGDPADLAAGYLALRPKLPNVRVIGGCCGTDISHVTAIAEAWCA
jgi:S-methylmethionine-dependent homocysteine/selenocysteine methylase